jgi:hypothetical protein
VLCISSPSAGCASARAPRAYAQRRAAEGRTKREIIRCLKRYIAREVYNALRADLTDTRPEPPRHTTTITCGNPGFGINRKRTRHL